ncbi:restriction endonuclease subunit S [candidate division KSB1 bacterium]|nr:restriction endonuclease subunit S [candidate division KSB1 bacterium]
MEVREGYKQTEVGVIPDDWEIGRIRNLASITTGAKNTQDKIEDGEFPFFVRSSIVEKINTYSFDGEAVLTAGDGVGTGKTFHYINAKFDFHQRVYKISDFENGLNGYFFYLYFSNNFYDRIMSMTAKSSVDSVRMEMIADMIIPLPPLPEQHAIAAALSDVDALLTALDALIAKKRLIKQGAMQELLTGKKRLPGFSGEWDSPKIGDLFIFKNGLNKAKEFFGYGTPIVNYMDVYGKRGIYSNDLRGRVSLSGDEVRAFEVRKGDVFFTRTSETAAEVGISSVMLDQPRDTVFSGFILRARPKDNSLDDQFKKFCFSTDGVRKQITSQSTETTRALTSGRNLSIVAIARPPLEEQKAIAELLNDMDAEIAALEQRREKTRRLKQGMMQELLTGRTRLL